MDLPSLVGGLAVRSVYLVLGVILIATSFSCLRAVFDPLRRIPGPFGARFSRLWYLKHVNRGQQHVDEVKLHAKYGPIIRLAPGQYSFNDLSAAKVIYDHGSKLPKSDFYMPFGVPDAVRANIFQDQNIETHAMKRRKIASLYSMTSIISYEPYVDSCMQTYFTRLDQFAQADQPFDLPSWMQYYAFDVIGAISIGEPFGFLTHGYDFPGIIREMHTGQAFGVHFGSYAGSWFIPFATTMLRLGKTPPFMATQRYTQASLEKKHRDLENGKTAKEAIGKQDFAEKLLSLKADGKIIDADLEGCIRANIAAGSDTTGISLSAIFYYLLSSPSALAKLWKEVNDFKQKQENPEDLITFAQAQDLPYLQATIKEALRLHPALGMQLPRVVPEGGSTLAGQFFPAGTVVGINAWVIHRQPEIFGDDAEQFRPERWLDKDEEKVKHMDRSLFTFGAGSRTCIGRNISMLEMQKLVPELVRRYDFKFANGGEKWESLNRLFVYEKYQCTVQRRESQ